MPEPSATHSESKKPSRTFLLRLVLILVLVLILIPVLIGFYLTTDSGVRRILLPMVSKKIGLKVEAAHAAWNPFSSLILDEVILGPSNDPILKVKQLIVHYDGKAIVRGKFQIKALTLDGTLGSESLGGLTGKFSIDLAMLENNTTVLKQAQITLSRNGTQLTSISATGPLDFVKREAELDLQIGPLKSNALNILFAGRKLDFLDSSLSYAGHLSLSRGGNLLGAVGKLEATPLRIASPQIPTGAWKPVMLNADHAVELDWSKRQVRISKLDLEANQEGKPLLKSALSKPMLLSWDEAGTVGAEAGDADATLQLFPTDCTPYLSFLGLPSDWRITSGLLDANAIVSTSNQGRSLVVDGHIGLSKIAMNSSSAKLEDATLLFDGKLNLQNLKSAQFQQSAIKIFEKGKPLCNATLDGKFDFASQTGAGLLQFDVPLPALLAIIPVADLNISSGLLGGKIDWKLRGSRHLDCNGKVTLAEVSLACSPWPERKFYASEVVSQIQLKLDDRILDLKTTAEIKNLSAEGPAPSSLKPLKTTLSTDLSFTADGTLTLRSLALQLEPTPTAKNSFQVSGTSRSSPSLFFADFKIEGHSLDLTSYWDQLFPNTSGSPTQAVPAPSESFIPPIGGTIAASGSPPATQPVRNVNLKVSIDSLRIHDFNLTEVTLPFRQNDQGIELNPVQVKINGTPVTAKIQADPGQANSRFRFEVATEGLSIGPIVDVLRPDLKGRVGGALTAQLNGSGAGISRSDLEQNLTGILQIAIRKAHLEEVPAVQKFLKQLSNELLSPDIATSTVDDMDASAKIESGKVFTDNFHARGSAIEASLKGNVFVDQRLDMLATLKIKKEVMARSSALAPILQLISSDTKNSQTGVWYRLPGSGAVAGTLKEPTVKFKLDKVAEDALKNAAGSILKEFLKPRKDPNSPPPDQNQPGSPPPESKPSDHSLQDFLNNLKKKK